MESTREQHQVQGVRLARAPLQVLVIAIARAPCNFRENFGFMSIIFGIGHGTTTAALSYASSSMDARVAYVGNGILYLLMLLSSMFFAVPVSITIGNKGSIVLGFFLYSLYLFGFAYAVVSASASPAQWWFFCTSSAMGGIAAGLLWTAQGAYMSHSSAAVSEEEQNTRKVTNGELATTFAFWYLLFEVLLKAVFSLAMSGGSSAAVVLFAFAGLTLASSAAMMLVANIQLVTDKTMIARMLDAPRLWSNVRTWLLSPTNFTFGMSAAFVQGYFNANYGAVQLGPASIGWCNAFLVVVAIAASRFYGSLRERFGTGLPISIGAAAFALVPTLVLTTGCSHWGLWLLVIYGLQGAGRACYENTNKALFADTFPGADTEGAFANCVLQFSFASAVQYFLSAVLTGTALEIIVIVFALSTPLAYLANTSLDAGGSAEKQLLLSSEKQPAYGA